MAYYLGRDVKVYLTTESPEAQVDVSSFAVSAISAGGSSVAAVATLTITDTNVLQGRTIIITTTDGTTVTALETDTTTTTVYVKTNSCLYNVICAPHYLTYNTS